MSRLVLFFLGSAVFAFISGCGEPSFVAVSGTVSFNDQPLPHGQIVFLGDEPAFGPDAGPVEDGKFQFLARPGKKRVEIRAGKIKPRAAKGMYGEPLPSKYIPKRYNEESELTAEVSGSGRQVFEFKLDSKK